MAELGRKFDTRASTDTDKRRNMRLLPTAHVHAGTMGGKRSPRNHDKGWHRAMSRSPMTFAAPEEFKGRKLLDVVHSTGFNFDALKYRQADDFDASSADQLNVNIARRTTPTNLTYHRRSPPKGIQNAPAGVSKGPANAYKAKNQHRTRSISTPTARVATRAHAGAWHSVTARQGKKRNKPANDNRQPAANSNNRPAAATGTAGKRPW
jgi:hypothetical protein